MRQILFSEYGLWLAAALALGLRAIAFRMELERPTRCAGWTAFAAFILGAMVWMFSDTYAYYFGSKQDALRISYWGSYREHEMWKEIVGEFRRRHPEILIKQEYITDRYEEKIQQLLLADEAPDVMLFQDEPMPRFITSNKFLCLDDLRQTPGLEIDLNDYWETAVLSFQKDGKSYGIPIWGGDCLVIYNRDVFRDADVPEPPESWDIEEFIETCQRLTADEDGDGRIDRYAFLVPSWVYWLPYHYAFGATYLDESRKKWTLWGAEATASYRFCQDLLHRYHVSPHRDELTEGGSVAFMTGRVAMFVSGPWAMPPLNEAGVNYDIAPIPRGPGGYGTRVTWDCLALFSGSNKKDQAWRFIHFATSLEGQKIVAKYQRSIPALKAGQTAFVQGNPEVRAHRFVDALSYARLQPITEWWSLMEREISSEVDLMMDNKQTVEETLEHLALNVHLTEHFEMPRGSRGDAQ